MKSPCLFALLLTAIPLISHAEAEGPLESVKRMTWKHQTYANARYGISVAVQERPDNLRKGSTWGRGTYKIIAGDGCKISVSTHEDNTQFSETRVPLKSETIEYLLGARNEPDYLRFIAATHIIQSGLPAERQVELLRKGIGLPEATLRHYIWGEIRRFKPHEKIADLLHIALRDPCLEIAHDSLGAIIDEYKLTASNGAKLPWSSQWRGPGVVYYIIQHQEILGVAKALRLTRPDLLPEEELRKIYSRAMPSDAWFEMLDNNNDPRAREYFQDYVAKTKAELEGTASPATRPEPK